MSLGARIRATFFAPATLPRLLRPTLPWLDVLLISTAVAVLAVLFVPAESYLQRMRDPVNRRGVPVEVTSPPDVIATWGRGMDMLATLATHPVVAVTLAGALTLVFTIFFRGPATFRDHLSLATHALLIPALGTVLAILFRTIAPADWVESLTLGRGGDASFLESLVAGVDPFVIWMLIVLGVAVHGLDPARSRFRASAILLAGYLILVGTSTALLHPELLSSG